KDVGTLDTPAPGRSTPPIQPPISLPFLFSPWAPAVASGRGGRPLEARRPRNVRTRLPTPVAVPTVPGRAHADSTPLRRPRRPLPVLAPPSRPRAWLCLAVTVAGALLGPRRAAAQARDAEARRAVDGALEQYNNLEFDSALHGTQQAIGRCGHGNCS